MTKIILLWKHMSFSQTPLFLPGRVENIISLCKPSSMLWNSENIYLAEFTFLSLEFWLRKKFIVRSVDICKSCGNQNWCEQCANITTSVAFCSSTFFGALVFVAKYVSADLSRESSITLCSACSWNIVFDSLGHSHKTCRR